MEIKEKGIVKNGFFSILQILVQTVTWAGVYYLIIHIEGGKVGKEQIGLVSTITGVPLTLMIFGSGVSGCLIRYIPMYVAGKTYDKVKQVILNGLLLNMLLAAVICGAGFIFGDALLRFYFEFTVVPPFYHHIYVVSLITFFITFAGSVFSASLDGLQMMYRRNVIGMITSVLFCTLALTLIHYLGIIGLVYAQVVQSAIMALLSFAALQRTGVFGVKAALFNKEHWKLFLTYGQGLQLVSFSIIFYDPVIRFFLKRYTQQLEVVGIYDMVSKAITLVRGVIVNAIQAIVPVVSRLRQENRLDVGELNAKSVRGGALLSVLGFSAVTMAAVPLIVLTDRGGFGYYFVFLATLSAGYVVNVIASGPYLIMMGLGEIRPIIISHVLSTLLNAAFFALIGRAASPFLLILPPALAVTLSSLYLLRTFYVRHGLASGKPAAEDMPLYILAVVGVALSAVIFLTTHSLWLLVATDTASGILCLYLVYRNSFLASIFEKAGWKLGR